MSNHLRSESLVAVPSLDGSVSRRHHVIYGPRRRRWNMANGNGDNPVSETTFTVNLGDVELDDEERAEIQKAILRSVVERVGDLNNLRASPIDISEDGFIFRESRKRFCRKT